jgi:hypothetical protein
MGGGMRMGEFEAIGDVVTGSVLARAVEPEAGDSGHTHEKACLNCGTPLSGPFCAACGQKAHVHRSLRGFLTDMVQGLFNFDGKLWRTLPMLAWRPGELTRRYIAGERARFISPVALYLFTVFAMFAVFNLNGGFGDMPTSAKEEIQKEIRLSQEKLTRLEQQRAEIKDPSETKAKLDEKISDLKSDIKGMENAQRGEFKNAAVETSEDLPDWMDDTIGEAAEDPKLAAYKVQDAASKFSWLLIPLSVPFLWLLFPFSRKYRLYDHTVFVTYSLSFMMMLVIAAGALVAVGSTALASFLFFVPPFHMYRQLKGAYQLGRFSAILRTIALTTFAFIAAGLFVAAAFAIGLVGG